MKKGHLIVFTGIDGSGKTTQANLLVEQLKKDGIDVLYVWSRWEPFLLRPFITRWKKQHTKHDTNPDGDYRTLKNRKKLLLDNPYFRFLWLTLFFIDYGVQIFARVRIELTKKDLIVSDRIFFDSIIDQSINLGSRKNLILDKLDSFWMRWIFPRPDMVICVDCPSDIAFSRKEDAPNINYLTERRKLYLDLLEKYKWIKIDGTLPVNEIAIKVKGEVYHVLNKWNIYNCNNEFNQAK